MSLQSVAPSVRSGGHSSRPVFGATATAEPVPLPSRLMQESTVAARFALCVLLVELQLVQH